MQGPFYQRKLKKKKRVVEEPESKNGQGSSGRFRYRLRFRSLLLLGPTHSPVFRRPKIIIPNETNEKDRKAVDRKPQTDLRLAGNPKSAEKVTKRFSARWKTKSSLSSSFHFHTPVETQISFPFLSSFLPHHFHEKTIPKKSIKTKSPLRTFHFFKSNPIF